jgi:hypothetical protein
METQVRQPDCRRRREGDRVRADLMLVETAQGATATLVIMLPAFVPMTF